MFLGYSFTPAKETKQFTISVTVGAATNVILNLILIPRMDSFGAAIASLIAEIVVTAIQVVFVRKCRP